MRHIISHDNRTLNHALPLCPLVLQLAPALAANKKLAELDVGGNNVGPEGAKALATALKVGLGRAVLHYQALSILPSNMAVMREYGSQGHKALKTLELLGQAQAPSCLPFYFLVHTATRRSRPMEFQDQAG